MARRPFWVDFFPKKWSKTEILDWIPVKTPCTRTTIFTNCNAFFPMVHRPFLVDFCPRKPAKNEFQTKTRFGEFLVWLMWKHNLLLLQLLNSNCRSMDSIGIKTLQTRRLSTLDNGYISDNSTELPKSVSLSFFPVWVSWFSMDGPV